METKMNWLPPRVQTQHAKKRHRKAVDFIHHPAAGDLKEQAVVVLVHRRPMAKQKLERNKSGQTSVKIVYKNDIVDKMDLNFISVNWIELNWCFNSKKSHPFGTPLFPGLSTNRLKISFAPLKARTCHGLGNGSHGVHWFCCRGVLT